MTPERRQMMGFLAMIAAAVAAILGYRQARSFVRNRLRYVDGAHTSRAALIAGVAAAAVAMPVVWLLPIVGGGTALVFGASVGAGVAAGSREIRTNRLIS
jgi:hypothetical protein